MGFVPLKDNDGSSGRHRPVGAIVTFSLITVVGLLALAGTVLLPEYAALDDLRTQRDAIAHQVKCDEKLSAYNDRMIRATQDDPVLIARLMIRHGNYHPAGCETVKMKSSSEQSVPERLLREADNPPQRKEPRLLVRAGVWLTDTTTSRCMILLAMAMIVTGIIVGWAGATRSVPCGKRRPTEDLRS